MEKVFVVIFQIENEAYQAFDEMKKNMENKNYVIQHMKLVKKVEGKIIPCEGCDVRCRVTSTALGGLVGMVVGALGGPIGVVLGGAAGSLISNKVVSNHIEKAKTYLETVSRSIQDKEIALIALVEEKLDGSFADEISNFNVEIQEKDAAQVKAEFEGNLEFQKRIEQFNKDVETNKKVDAFKEEVANKQAALKDEISNIREGIKIVHDEMEARLK